MEYSFLKPPPPTKYNVLSLGAGVQSTCMALMAAKGEITPMPDFAIFADTMSEPKSVYKHLEWLRLRLPFPIYQVTAGSLEEDALKIVNRKSDNSTYVNKVIPIFGIKPNGEKTAAIGRSCTRQFKIAPIHKFIKKKCEIKRGQKDPTVTEWIGISWDEMQRMKESTNKWSHKRHPLMELKMTRTDCKIWMKKNNYPEPPRSACYFCPFHNKESWRYMKQNEPEEFKKAILFDKKLRELYRKFDSKTDLDVYLNIECKPLDEIDLSTDEEKGQLGWDFKSECEGMCGV